MEGLELPDWMFMVVLLVTPGALVVIVAAVEVGAAADMDNSDLSDDR